MCAYEVPGRPSRRWVRVVALALRAVPAGPARERYRQELVAEMYGMEVRVQRHHALGVLRSALALRVALTNPKRTTTKEAMMMKKRWRCRLGIHQYTPATTDDGGHYTRCQWCGKDYGSSSSGPGDRLGFGLGVDGPG